MSKNINVNPGNYKVAGRERPGKDIPADLERQEFARQKAKDQLSPESREGRRTPKAGTSAAAEEDKKLFNKKGKRKRQK